MGSPKWMKIWGGVDLWRETQPTNWKFAKAVDCREAGLGDQARDLVSVRQSEHFFAASLDYLVGAGEQTRW
jgi:hypothetical protein